MDAQVLAQAIVGAVEASPTPIERMKSRFTFDSTESGKLAVDLKIKKVRNNKAKRDTIDIDEWTAMYNIFHR